MVTKKITKTALILLGLVAFTACPGKSPDRINTIVTPNQAPVGPGGVPANPGQMDSSIKTIQCEFEGQRYKNSKYFNSNVSIPKTVALITLDGQFQTPIDLRTKFLGIDIGSFGKISMQYVPAAKTKSGTDTIILIDDGLNKNMRMSQSGFAGQAVKLEAQDDNMFVTVSCKGTSQFKSGIAHTGKTNLVCRGKSSTAVTPEEKIDISIPLNSIQAGVEFTISDAVSAKLDSAATTITYSGSLDPDYAPTVTATASLKSSATFRIIDTTKGQNGVTEINVTCGIQ